MLGVLHDRLDLALGEGSGFTAHADETGDTISGAHGEPGVISHFQFDQHVAGKNFLADGFAHAPADLDFFLSWNQHLDDFVGQVEGLGALAQSLGDFFLMTRIDVDDVPTGLFVVDIRDVDQVGRLDLHFLYFWDLHLISHRAPIIPDSSLVDRQYKNRNIIIKKNSSALTEKVEIAPHTNFIDDEVLREAFGIEVYKDLLNPHSILVEGASDKLILLKAFSVKEIEKYGVTNGHGSNIDSLAVKLNDSGMSVLVILDDDSDGKKYKTKIINIGGSYSAKNVLTIRDLVGEVKPSGSIEDVLDRSFVESKFKEIFQQKFGATCNLTLSEDTPFLEQIKVFLHTEKKYTEALILEFKKALSDAFNPTKSSFEKDFPLLDKLIDEIQKKLN